jgi:hypothetical protein
MKRFLCFLLILLALAIPATPALAVEPVVIVHEEQIEVGPYKLTIGFSRWPLNADRSLDIVFMPEGGIEGLSGSFDIVTPSGLEDTDTLVRHPRMRTAWGLDVVALNEEGPWSIVFTINGPAGQGVGRFAPLFVGERPGPPIELSWLIGMLPIGGMLALVVVAWWRVRPGKQPDAWNW